ncbi:hypothetical protein EOD40_17590, partial [Flavobacterium sufflavum]
MKTILPQSRFLTFVFLIANLFFANVVFGQTVTLDQADLDYAPGETVIITGTGWHPGEIVGLQVDNITNPNIDCGPVTPQPHELWTVDADADGNFTAYWYVNDCELGADLLLGAYGNLSGFTYEVFFTDAPKVLSVAIGSQTPSPVTAGNNASYAITVFRGSGSGSSGAFTANLSITTTLPGGTSVSFSPSPVSFTSGDSSKIATLTISTTGSTPAGSTSFIVKAATSASDFAESTATLVVGGGNSAPVLAAIGNKNVNEQSALNFSVSASDQDLPAQTLTYSLDAASVTAGMTINGSTGAFSWTPTESQGGATYPVTITVTDNGTPNLADSETFNIVVAEVNDAPTGTDNTVTTNEDTDYTFTTTDFGFTDPNDTPVNTLFAVKVTTLPANGLLKLSGVNVTLGQFIPVASITAANLKFSPATNSNGTPYTSFTFQVQDNGGTASGGVDLDQIANTMTINVTSVNDAPSGADNTVTTNEDTDHTFTAVQFGFTDPNDTPLNTLLAVKVTTLPANGLLKLSGVNVTLGQFIPVASIIAGNLKFSPATNSNGTPYTSFTFQVQDNGGTASGGVDLDQIANTMTINVTSVNDAPVFTKGADQTKLEDAGAISVPGWATGIDDGDPELTQTLSFTVTNNN